MEGVWADCNCIRIIEKGDLMKSIKVMTTAELAKKCWGNIDPAECCDLYFIGAWVDGDLVAVKIGISKDCEGRLKDLQSHTFADLSIVGYHTYTSVELARKLEKQAHRDLKEYRIRGEWFRPDPIVLRYHPIFENHR